MASMKKTGNLPEVRVRIARVDTVIKLAGALEVDACELLRGITWITLDDVSRVYLPKRLARRLRADLPGYYGQVTFAATRDAPVWRMDWRTSREDRSSKRSKALYQRLAKPFTPVRFR